MSFLHPFSIFYHCQTHSYTSDDGASTTVLTKVSSADGNKGTDFQNLPRQPCYPGAHFICWLRTYTRNRVPVQDKLHDQASFNFQIDACNIFSGEKEANLVLKNLFYYISKCHYKGNKYNKHLRDTKVKQAHSENIHHHPPHPNSQRNEDIDVIGNISDFGTL